MISAAENPTEFRQHIAEVQAKAWDQWYSTPEGKAFLRNQAPTSAPRSHSTQELHPYVRQLVRSGSVLY